MKLRFLGAAQTVTGSRNLIKYGHKTLLIDAGLFQGPKDSRKLNWYPNLTASALDAIILTHAHIDHSGLIPKLVKEGFKGKIYCTKATFELCQIMLLDSAHLQEEDAKFANETGYSSHDPAIPLYTTEDAENSFQYFHVLTQDEWHLIFPGLNLRLTRSGHILGSSFVELSYENFDSTLKIVFSGDLGNGRSKIIKPPKYITEADSLVLESTYGDRLQNRVDPKFELAKIINETMEKNGVLVIPAFTVGRTQEILHLIRTLELEREISEYPVFVDSPMANSVNKVFLKHSEEHLLVLEEGKMVPPICPQCFVGIDNMIDSKNLINRKGPMIVITASGMLTGGRVMHHLKKRLPFPENTILFTGFQAINTKGRLLQEGIKSLRIHHEEIPVQAKIMTIPGLSAHADYDDTLEWLSHFRKLPKKIFINHGELEASTVLAQKIAEKFPSIECVIPKFMEEFSI